MKPGDRVSFEGRPGTVVRFMPGDMIDVQFDDVAHLERRHIDRLTPSGAQSRSNPSYATDPYARVVERMRWRLRRARWNSSDPYVVLGLPRGAGPKAIRKSYRKLALKHHPDRPGGSAEKFIELQRAYETLMQEKPAPPPRAPRERRVEAIERLSPEEFEVWKRERQEQAEEWKRIQALPTEAEREAAWAARLGAAAAAKRKKQSPAEQMAAERRQREAARLTAEQERAAKRAIKPEPFPTETDVSAVLRDRYGSMFTELDPPRLAADRSAYCGNPIDGVKYYLVVSEEKRRDIWYWIKKAEVEKAAQKSPIPGFRGQLPATGGPQDPVLQEGQVLPETTRAMLPLAERLLRADAQMMAAVASLYEQEPPPLFDMNSSFLKSSPLFVEARDNAKAIRDEAREKGGEKFWRGVALLAFFQQTFLGKKLPGARVFAEKVAPRKYTRPRPGLGMTEELAIKQKKVGLAEQEADPEYDFSVPDPESEDRIFYKIWSPESPGQARFQRFQPYHRRTLESPIDGTLVEAIVAASLRDEELRYVSGNEHRGVDSNVATAFVLAGGVSVDRTITTNPNHEVKRGAKISIGLWEKSRNPFFGWVRGIIPLREARTIEVCPPAEAQKVRAELTFMKRAVQRLDGAFGRVRSLFNRLSQDPGSLKPESVQQAMVGLADGFTGVLRWWDRNIQRVIEGDPVAARVQQMFIGSILDPTQPNAPIKVALTRFITDPDFAGLLYTGVRVLTLSVAQRDRMLKPTIGRITKDLTRKGFTNVRVVEWTPTGPADSGMGVAYDVPGSKQRSELTDPKTREIRSDKYAEFMKVLYGKKLADAELPGRPPGWAALLFFAGRPEVPVSMGVQQLRQKWAAGQQPEEKKIQHPMDDLWAVVQESLTDGAKERLGALRVFANGEGVDLLLKPDPYLPNLDQKKLFELINAGPKEWRQLSDAAREFDKARGIKRMVSASSARLLSTFVGQYAVGGALVGGQRVDPLEPGRPFDLSLPETEVLPDGQILPVARGPRMDLHWAIDLIVNHVYPTLLSKKTPQKQAAFLCTELLLLANFYEMLEGYALAGPLNPWAVLERGLAAKVAAEQAAKYLPQLYKLQAEREQVLYAAKTERDVEYAEKRLDDVTRQIVQLEAGGGVLPQAQLLRVALRQIDQREAELVGGRTLSEPRKFTAYYTYNPVLFELTRLYWPSRARGAEPGWGHLLGHWQAMKAVDDAGRYGYAMKITQEAAAQSKSPQEVITHVSRALLPGLDGLNHFHLMMRGRMVDPKTRRAVPAPEGFYAPFLLNWPLGIGVDGAAEQAQMWITDPFEYLRWLKIAIEPAITTARHIRRVGISTAEQPEASARAPRGDMPPLFRDRPMIMPESAVRAEYEVEEIRDPKSGVLKQLKPRASEFLKMLNEIDAAIEALK